MEQPPCYADWRWQEIIASMPLRNLGPDENRPTSKKRQIPHERIQRNSASPRPPWRWRWLPTCSPTWRYYVSSLSLPDVVKALLEQLGRKCRPRHRAALEVLPSCESPNRSGSPRLPDARACSTGCETSPFVGSPARSALFRTTCPQKLVPMKTAIWSGLRRLADTYYSLAFEGQAVLTNSVLFGYIFLPLFLHRWPFKWGW